MTQHWWENGGEHPCLFCARCDVKTQQIRKTTHNWATTKKEKTGQPKFNTEKIGASGWTALDGLKSNSFHPPLCIPQQTDPKGGGLARLPQAPPIFLLDNTHTPAIVLRVEWISIFLSFLPCRPFSSTTPISYVLTSIASSSLAAERIGIPAC